MVLKLIDFVARACISHKTLTKSQFLCGLPTVRQYCSKKDPPVDSVEKPNIKDPQDDKIEETNIKDPQDDKVEETNIKDPQDDGVEELSIDDPDVKELLEYSSPLREFDRDDFWASSPYPVGTVFRALEPEEDIDKGESKSVIMFPGQGNQFVGMAKNLLKYPVALDMFKTASDILNYDLLKICLEGPEKKLEQTQYCQPATFVCSLALLEKIKEEKPWVISNCIATCGYSLGELTALVFSGCINFEQGLNLVKIRAEAMEECCKKSPGGMLTVFLAPEATLSKGLSDSIEHSKLLGIEKPECAVASYLFPNCKVVAGHLQALKFLRANAKTYGIKRHSFIPVSGAFHSKLMLDAVEPFKKKLINMNINHPLVKVFSNVTGKPYIDNQHILRVLPKQIYSPVRWHQTISNVSLMFKKLGYLYFYECGPGNSLTRVAVKANAKLNDFCFAIKL